MEKLFMAYQNDNFDFWKLEKAIKNTGYRFGMDKPEYDILASYVRKQPSKHAVWKGSTWYMYSNDLVILYETSIDIFLSVWTLEGLLIEIVDPMENNDDRS